MQVSDSFQLRVVDEAQIDAALDQRIRDFLVLCFPKDRNDFSRSRGWHGSMPAFSVLLEDARGTFAGHAGVVDRTIGVDGLPVRIAGIQNVCVDPALRGQRHVDRLMSAAMDTARARAFELGMLFCVPELCGIYARNGWQPISGRRFVKRDVPGREIPFELKDAAMVYPLKRSVLPAGDIDLAGNDW